MKIKKKNNNSIDFKYHLPFGFAPYEQFGLVTNHKLGWVILFRY